MAKLKLPEQLKSWKVISQVSGYGSYPTFSVVRNEFDGSKITAVLTCVTFEGDRYNSDNVDLINEEAAFVKNIIKLRGVSNYIDAVVNNDPSKTRISLYLFTTDAKPLKAALDGKQFTDSEIVDFGIQISEMLEKLEQSNILHGNLKPDNIFINRDGSCVLGGFTAFEGNADDPSFLAPEMQQGKQPDYTTDIYSLGLIMYTMANGGKLPFEENGDRAAAVKKRSTATTVPAPATGSEKLKSVIVIACQPDNKNRWKNAGNIKNALAAIKSELPAQEKPAAPVIVPESTEFESNVFEEYSYEEEKEAPPAPKQDNEPLQPAPVMAMGAVIAAEAAKNAAESAEEVKDSEKEKAEPSGEADKPTDAAPEPTEAEKTAENSAAAEETEKKTVEKPEEKTADSASKDQNAASPVTVDAGADIDNRVFDDYEIQSRVFPIRGQQTGHKDYGAYFDDEPEMEYINNQKSANPSASQKQSESAPAAAVTSGYKGSGDNKNDTDNSKSDDDDREPTKRNKTFIAGIIVIVIAAVSALAGLGVLAAQNGWFPFGKTDKVEGDTSSTIPEITAATQPSSTQAAETTVPETTEELSDEEVTPENVVGYFYDYAVEVLEEQGFKVEYSEREYSDEWDEDFIISMSPDSSAPLKKGSTINLVRSRGSKSGSSSSSNTESSESDESSESSNSDNSSEESSSGSESSESSSSE